MLWFWVIVLVLLIGAIAVVASGRGDSMVDVYDDRPDVAVPAGRPLTADDLGAIRFNTGVRGYRMDEVDALLARLQAEMIEREGDHVEVLRPPVQDHPVQDRPVQDRPVQEHPVGERPLVEERVVGERQSEPMPLAEADGDRRDV